MRKFMRTRAAAPASPHPHQPQDSHYLQDTHYPQEPHYPQDAHPHLNGHATAATRHHLNGHANGSGPRREDHHSTLSSRYWSGSEGSRGGVGAGVGVGTGALWEDPEFPATWRAIGDKRRANNVLWLRPHELCPRPVFGGEDAGEGEDEGSDQPDHDTHLAARWCVEVGEVGDAHVCAAAGALALTPRLLARVAPPQPLAPAAPAAPAYTGAFRFNFWVFGAWHEVAVDDRLPTRGGRPLFSRARVPHPHAPHYFLLPLLEKAYAKLYGSYAALREGSPARALQDLTGGIVQSFSLRHQPLDLTFQVLNSAVPRSTLVVATPSGDRARGPLQPAHGYCVTGLARLRPPLTASTPSPGEGGVGAGCEGAEGALVRVRATAGRGPWADERHWRALPAADRDLLAARAAPGDFWMSFVEFARAFSSLELVHVGPDDWLLEPALRARRPWRAVLARRRWRTGYNAGGSPHAKETTGTNPQFHVAIGRGEASKCHVVVSVTQQYAVGGGRARSLHAIGFSVYALPAGAAPRRPLAALAGLRALDVTHECRAREVATFFTLPPGQYLVVPHTRRPHTDAAFLLRLLTDDHADVWEVNEDNMIVRDMSTEFLNDDQLIPKDVRATIVKLLSKRNIDEVDAAGLRAVLRRVWRACLVRRPSLELCRALLALRDGTVSGRLPAAALPPLVALLAYWRHAYLQAGTGVGAGVGGCRRAPCPAPAYRLRALLWAAGLTASNKVLECLVLRFARRATIDHEAYVMALARLHLAHERYRALDTKMKSNPLSLEEMILMTIYS